VTAAAHPAANLDAQFVPTPGASELQVKMEQEAHARQFQLAEAKKNAEERKASREAAKAAKAAPVISPTAAAAAAQAAALMSAAEDVTYAITIPRSAGGLGMQINSTGSSDCIVEGFAPPTGSAAMNAGVKRGSGEPHDANTLLLVLLLVLVLLVLLVLLPLLLRLLVLTWSVSTSGGGDQAERPPHERDRRREAARDRDAAARSTHCTCGIRVQTPCLWVAAHDPDANAGAELTRMRLKSAMVALQIQMIH